MRLGDLLVCVDDIVAESPRPLAQSLKERGVSQSGKLVVMKVNLGTVFCFVVLLSVLYTVCSVEQGVRLR